MLKQPRSLRLPLKALTIMALALLQSCQWAQQLSLSQKPKTASSPRAAVRKVHPFNGLALHADAHRRPYAHTKPSINADFVARVPALLAQRLPAEVVVSPAPTQGTLVYTPTPPKPRVVNLNVLYGKIQAEFVVQKEDDEKMRAFKAMKKDLDGSLARAGYTQEEIKRFYVLQYLGSGHSITAQAELPAEQKDKRKSEVQPSPAEHEYARATRR